MKKISLQLIEIPSAASVSERSDTTDFAPLTEQEIEFHIWDCERLYRTAFQAWLDFHIPHDRDEALLHLHRMNQAMVNRPGQYERHVAFERRLDEGVDYFQCAGARDRLDMERRAA